MNYKLRMRDLEKACELPASAIRFYLKMGLLPEPHRPTPNSALYGHDHIDALKALKRIKALAPELPLIQLKRVLELVDQGVEPEVALSLHRAVAQGGSISNHTLTLSELVRAADVEPDLIERLIDASILVPLQSGADRLFNEVDLQVVRGLASVISIVPNGVAALSDVADLLRRASAREMEIRNTVSSGLSPDQAALISHQMQEWGSFWHAYLFARLRLQDIARHGLGETLKDSAKTEES